MTPAFWIFVALAGYFAFLRDRPEKTIDKFVGPLPDSFVGPLPQETPPPTFSDFATADTPRSLDELYLLYGKAYGVDPNLLKAVAIVESNENPNAFNAADPSIGVMQLLCVGFGSGKCTNRLNLPDWPPQYVEQLFDPDYNVSIGAQILAWNISQYGTDKGIAVYNNYSARNTQPGYPFPNQEYVNKVKLQLFLLTDDASF